MRVATFTSSSTLLLDEMVNDFLADLDPRLDVAESTIQVTYSTEGVWYTCHIAWEPMYPDYPTAVERWAAQLRWTVPILVIVGILFGILATLHILQLL